MSAAPHAPVLTFILIALSIWFLQHAYVFLRLSSLPWLGATKRRRLWVWLSAIPLLLSYPLCRYAYSLHWDGTAHALEVFGTSWMGTLLLLFALLLVVELLSLGGLLFRPHLPRLRLAACLSALVLAVIALVQGHRDPVVSEAELTLPKLPASLDGTRVVLVTDLHLGTRFDAAWLSRLSEKIEGLRPDLLLLSGDIVDGDMTRVEPLSPELKTLRARLGVWAVLGNHDAYGNARWCADILGKAGIHVLRDSSALAAPGLRVAGVDDLGLRSRDLDRLTPLDQAFASLRSEEACIYLSHTPVLAEAAAARGAGLMLSGHTHGGQLWPFGYLVKSRFPLFTGFYDVSTMKVLVSRGAGGWGPRMRLWAPGQIHLLTLRSP